MNKTEDVLLILALVGGVGYFGYTLWKKRPGAKYQGPSQCYYANTAYCDLHPNDVCCGGSGVPDCSFATHDYCTYGNPSDPCCVSYQGPPRITAQDISKTGYPGAGARVLS